MARTALVAALALLGAGTARAAVYNMKDCPALCDTFTYDDWAKLSTAQKNITGNSDKVAGKLLTDHAQRATFMPSKPGTYNWNYVAFDACNKESTKAISMTYFCNQPPVWGQAAAATGYQYTVSIAAGAEVLLAPDVTDPEDDTLSYEWCITKATASAADNTPVWWGDQAGDLLRDNGPNAFLKPPVTGHYEVTATVSDGCNRARVTYVIDATVKCCNDHAAAVGTSTVQWSVRYNQYNIALDSSLSTESSCLPPDYRSESDKLRSSIDTPAESGGRYKYRYSPINPATGEIATNLIPSGGGTPDWSKKACTWPGASNFAGANKDAQYDDGSCTCAGQKYQWDILGGTRTATPTTGVKTGGGAAGEVDWVDYTYVADSASVTFTNKSCSHDIVTGPSGDTTSGLTGSKTVDVRTRQLPLAGDTSIQGPAPSTSWKADYTYTVTRKTVTTYWAYRSDVTTMGEDTYSCKLHLPNRKTATPTAQVTAGKQWGYDLKNCLGDYQFELSAWRDGQLDKAMHACTMDKDSFTVSVTCNRPPYVEVLCDQHLLYKGDDFQKLTIDARTTFDPSVPDADYIQFNFTVYELLSAGTAQQKSLAPIGLMYPGGGPAGPAKNTPLGSPASAKVLTFQPNITGEFQATKGGIYKVELAGDDSCNPKVTDYTLVNAECLTLRPMSTITIGSTTFNSGGARNTVTAATGQKGTASLALDGVYTGDNQTLNYAYRVLEYPSSRPKGLVLDAKRTVPAGLLARDSNTNGGHDCILGSSWKWSSPAGASQTKISDLPGITANFLFKGNYDIAASLLDGCQVATDTAIKVNVACTTQLTGTPAATVKGLKWWQGAFFEDSGSGVPGAGEVEGSKLAVPTATGATEFDWFVKSAPATSIYTTGKYTYMAAAADYAQCESGDVSTTWNVGSIMPAVSNGAGQPPIFRSSGNGQPIYHHNAGNNPASNTQDHFKVDTAGAYVLTLQADNQCDFAEADVTITAACNEPATLVTDANKANFAGVGATTGLTASYPATVMYDCKRNRYNFAYMRAVGDQGSTGANALDAFSAKDVLTYTYTYNSAPAGSWLSVEKIKYQLRWRTKINGAAVNKFDDDDAVNSWIKTQVIGNLVTAIQTTVKEANDDGKAALFTADRVPINGAAFDVAKESAWVDWERVDCYDWADSGAGYGQVLDLTLNFYVYPDKIFRAPGTAYTAAYVANGDTGGIDGSTKDTRPLSNWNAAWTAATTATAASKCPICDAMSKTYDGDANGFQMPPAAAYPAPSNTATPIKRTAASVWMTTSTTATQAAAYQSVSSAFLPDIDGSYSFSVGVTDSCPGGTIPAGAKNTYTVSVSPIPCAGMPNSRTQLNVSAVKSDGASTPPYTNSYVQAWKGRTDKFGAALEVTGLWMHDDDDTTSTFSNTGCVATGDTGCTFPTLAAGKAAKLDTTTDISTSNGAYIKFTVATNSPPRFAGQEVQLGWVAKGATTMQSFFVIGINQASNTYTVPLPTELAISGQQAGQFAFLSTASTTITGTQVFTGKMIGPSSVCASTFEFSATDNGSPIAIGTIATGATSGSITYTGAPKKVINVSPALPDNGAHSLVITFTAKQVLPYFASVAATCAATSPTTVSYTTTCPNMGLGAREIKPGNTANFGSQNLNLQSNFEGVNYDRVDFQAVWSESAYKGFENDPTFGFAVTNAPANSHFNVQHLIDTWIREDVNKIAPYTGPNTPLMNNPVTMTKQTNTTLYPGARYHQVVTTITGNKTMWEYRYVKPEDVSIKLYAKDAVSDTSAATYKDSRGENIGLTQLDRMRMDRKASTCFQPDVPSAQDGQAATNYEITITAADGCQSQTTKVQVTANPCTVPVIDIATPTSATGKVLRRVNLVGTLKDAAGAPLSVQRFWWKLETPPLPATSPETQMPSLLNAKSLKPSFIPTVAGDYKITLWATNGCEPVAPKTITYTVACAADPPILATTVTAADDYDSWHNDQLSLVMNGGANNQPYAEVEIMGQPSCPVLSSVILFSSFTCPSSTFGVRARPVATPQTSAAPVTPAEGPYATTTMITITVLIDGKAGLPASLNMGTNGVNTAVNPLTPNAPIKKQPIVVTLTPIGLGTLAPYNVPATGVDCANVKIVDRTAGTISCWVPARSIANTPPRLDMRVEVAIFKQSSHVSYADATFSYVHPAVTGIKTPAPTVGGTVTLMGTGLTGTSVKYWMVTFNGRPCTSPMAGTGADAGTLSCQAVAGAGQQQPVQVTVLYGSVDPYTGAITGTQDSTPTTYIGAYASPAITALAWVNTAPNMNLGAAPAAGGMRLRATVTNLGPQFRDVAFDPTGSSSGTDRDADNTAWKGLTVWYGDQQVTKFWVTQVESSPAAADNVLEFDAPPASCAAGPVALRVARYGRVSNTMSTVTYGPTTVTCVGEPFVDATKSGCARVLVDGENLIGPGEESASTVVFIAANDPTKVQPCGDVRVESAYRRFSCRVPSGVRPGDKIKVTTCRGASNGDSPALPQSIAYATCGSSFLVGDNKDFGFDVEPPIIPSKNTTGGGRVAPASGGVVITPSGQVVGPNGQVVQGAVAWKDQPVNNETFAGVMITMLVVLVFAYPIVWTMNMAASRGWCCFAKRASAGARAPQSLQIPDWQRNPVTGGSGASAAPAPARAAAAPRSSVRRGDGL